LCVTERTGVTPAAIEARLEPHGERQRTLRGQKRWATLPGTGGLLFVAASEGIDEQGKKRIRVVRVDSTAPGVQLHSMPQTPFVPEIPHAEVRLEDVLVDEDALLPGDGYTRYIKPFRTIEDIHVQAASLAYLLRETRAIGSLRSLEERLIAGLVALHGLAGCDPSAPEVHIALGGVLHLSKAMMSDIELAWARSESPASARWERDKLLFGIAESARARRLEQAWRHFDGIAAALTQGAETELS
jgi:acyl-CoA dehydrogenase